MWKAFTTQKVVVPTRQLAINVLYTNSRNQHFLMVLQPEIRLTTLLKINVWWKDPKLQILVYLSCTHLLIFDGAVFSSIKQLVYDERHWFGPLDLEFGRYLVSSGLFIAVQSCTTWETAEYEMLVGDFHLAMLRCLGAWVLECFESTKDV